MKRIFVSKLFDAIAFCRPKRKLNEAINFSALLNFHLQFFFNNDQQPLTEQSNLCLLGDYFLFKTISVIRQIIHTTSLVARRQSP